MKGRYTPVLILGVITVLAVAGLVALAFAPNAETQFIQNSLASLALLATGAIAALVRPGLPEDAEQREARLGEAKPAQGLRVERGDEGAERPRHHSEM